MGFDFIIWGCGPKKENYFNYFLFIFLMIPKDKLNPGKYVFFFVANLIMLIIL